MLRVLADRIYRNLFAVLLLAAITIAAVLIVVMAWPAADPVKIERIHVELVPDHLHLANAKNTSEGSLHSHALVISSHHPEWPRPR